MRHRLLTSAAVALAVAATTVPFAHATDPDAGNKSDYPQLFGHAADIDDGYKSGYPQLHAIHTYKATTSPAAKRRRGLPATPTPRNPHLGRTSLTDPDRRPRLPLERRGHRRWNSSPGDLPRGCRRPRPQPPEPPRDVAGCGAIGPRPARVVNQPRPLSLWRSWPLCAIPRVMSEADQVGDVVERGREAAARGSWREAYDLLSSVESAELSPGDLELIAEATSWTGPSDRCIDAAERAFNGYLSRDDGASAARIALRLARGYYLLSAGSVAGGWVRRAEHLLEDQPECVEHGQLARLRGVAANVRGDLGRAQEQLGRALEIARRFGDRDLEALTLHNQGSVCIATGDVDDGWALIDESAAAAAAGALWPTATGSVYCWTISTCRDLQEVRRAGEWTARFEHWCERTSLPGRLASRLSRSPCRGAPVEGSVGRGGDGGGGCVRGLSRIQHARRGRTGERRARRPPASSGRPGGRLGGFRRAVEAGREPQPGLALLRMAEGKPNVGLAELTRVLADVPDDRVERARLLPAFVELAVAAERLETARGAAEELDALATLYGSDALIATACWARGLVDLADGAPAAAISPLRESVQRWHALDAPYEAARARTVLAEAYQATEEEDSAELELDAAHAIFERLGAVSDARRVTDLLRGDRGDAVTATFMFSDICGSTNLVEAIGDAPWLDLVDWHDRTLRGLFREHRGEEVDHAGDGFFVAFTTAGSALGCAVAIQQALAEHRRQHGYAPPVRIGVHSASAMQVDGGYRGKGIHTAARIGALAAADEVVSSREAADVAGLRFSNARTVELKGLLDPIELVTIDWA